MFERSSRLVTFLVDLYPLRVFPFLSLMRSRAELALFLTSFCSVLFHFPKVSSSAGGRTWSLSTWKRRSHPFSPGIFSSEKLVPFRRLSVESRVSKNKKIKKQSREYILNKYVNKYSIEKEGKRKRVRPCLSASAVEEKRNGQRAAGMDKNQFFSVWQCWSDDLRRPFQPMARELLRVSVLYWWLK